MTVLPFNRASPTHAGLTITGPLAHLQQLVGGSSASALPDNGEEHCTGLLTH